MKEQLILIPFYLLNSFNTPKNNIENRPTKPKQNEIQQNAFEFTINPYGDYEEETEDKIFRAYSTFGNTGTEDYSVNITYYKYTQITRIYEDEETFYYDKCITYEFFDIYTTIGTNTTQFIFETPTTFYSTYYYDIPKQNINYKLENSILNNFNDVQTKYVNEPVENDTIPFIVSSANHRTLTRYTIQDNEQASTTDINNIMSTDILVTYNKNTEINVNYDALDLPSLLWEILAMPFAFISQAFDLTLFPGTPYQINISNTILVFIGLLILLVALKIVLGILL